MVCKGCGSSELKNKKVKNKGNLMNISQIPFRLQVHGHQVRRQLRLQSGLQVRLQKRTQGSVLQDQVEPGNDQMNQSQ